MGKREKTLISILEQGGANITDNDLPRPSMKDYLRSGIEDEINNVYKALGGILEIFPVRLKKWDMEINGVAVELVTQGDGSFVLYQQPHFTSLM